MKSIVEKLKQFQSPTPSRWREKAQARLAAQDERRKARKIALQVLDAMEAQHISEPALAERLGMSAQDISPILKGHKAPSPALTASIGSILGIKNFLLTLLLMAVTITAAAADQVNVRYVSKNGSFTGDGLSWKTAKLNIQDAINDLVNNHLSGEVWVAEGTYTPTESTESNEKSELYVSFKIPTGISVRGGFKGDETSKEQRIMDTSKAIGSYYRYRTVLSGDLGSQEAAFSWNKTKQQWNTSFYGNCYHVVTFATNGFDATTGRANPNGGAYRSAILEGCIIEHGNASNSDLSGHPHNAYGGGVYMVAGSQLENCMVRECSASRNGGGIYMDGGGYVVHVAVSNCQALGIGNNYGYGGGVCMDGPNEFDSGKVKTMIQRRGGIVGCVGRMGGGLAIIANDTRSDETNVNNRYKIACTALLVANNTATTEAGGIYMNKGGAITQMTVVRNKCNGSGVVSNGMTTGRSAGIYARDNAIVANSILWGGECSANNNIQYAATRSSNSSSLRPYVMYSSLTHSDYTDWSGVIKTNAMKLSEYNSADDEAKAGATHNASEGYALFAAPTDSAGYAGQYLEYQMFYGNFIKLGTHLCDASGNVVTEKDLKANTTYYIYDPSTGSKTDTEAVNGKDYYFFGTAYDWQPKSRSSLNHAGVLVVDIDRQGITPAFEVDYDIIGTQYNPRPTLGCYTTSSTTIVPEVIEDKNEVNFYVDPNEDSGEEYPSIGSSWSQPIRFMADALSFIQEDQKKATPVYCTSGRTINVYVKQGTVNNTNSSKIGTRARVTGFEIPSNTNIYGGYSSELTDTDKSIRDPHLYTTTITGDVQGDYEVNVAHLMRFQSTENSTFDGFSIRYANARSLENLGDAKKDPDGAAFVIYDTNNVTIKNCTVAGNTARTGAVAHINNVKSVTFENCIFHNNESREVDSNGKATANNGNILVNDKSKNVVFNHCDFMRNVGFAIDNYGQVTVKNSMFYGNMQEPVSDTRGQASKALAAVRLKDNGVYVSDHNLYDAQSETFLKGLTGDSKSTSDQTILDYTFSETSVTYPRFINPTKNAGVTTSGDATYYGRSVSFMPHNNNPMVNAASTTDDNGNELAYTAWGTDMVGTARNYGGLPDIGAIENYQSTTGENAYSSGQLPYGGAIYVRDYRDSDGNIDNSIDNRDGSSWSHALNGNATTYSYAATTYSYTAVAPTASSVKQPTAYKFATLQGGTSASATKYYATGDSNKESATLGNTTTAAAGDNFILIDAGSSFYYIYDVTKGMYLTWTNTKNGNGNVVLSSSKESNATWKLTENNSTLNTYLVSPSSNTSTYLNYYGAFSNKLGFYSSSKDGNVKWVFYQKTASTSSTTTTGLNGLQLAINRANDYFNGNCDEASYTPKEVHVGAGTYSLSSTLSWKEGANVKGGYPGVGNPGENERNIGNKDSYYMTILDGQSKIRVLKQDGDFSAETDFEGFTIQNGVCSGTTYGAGAYLQKNGYLLNCLVQKNTYTMTSDNTANSGGGGVYMASGSYMKNCKIQLNKANNTVNTKYPCGAGVFSAGGILENTLIVENEAYSTQQNILGAALYISSKSQLYNCTIAYNFGNVTQSVAATGGVWDASGSSEFYNCIMWGNYANGNTWENMVQVGVTGYSNGGGVNKFFHNCYSTAVYSSYASDDYTDTTKVSMCDKGITSSNWTSSNHTDPQKYYKTYYANCRSNEPFLRASDGTTDYSLKPSALACINKGSYESTLDSLGITVDITGADRFQDCKVDKGAYEYNGSLAISPDVATESGSAIYYVTPDGLGTSSGENPTNAACAAKLQKVLDAAGRYKYNNPETKVIVKVANSSTLANNGSRFTYYATRTTDDTDDDVRVWSIIVPRGVEVWGGYSDSYTSADDNGFYTKQTDGTYKSNRSITGNPTYFDSHYTSSDQSVTCYHVVTFTDRVFDADGNPYVSGDVVGESSKYVSGSTATYLSQKSALEDKKVTDRAVLDGIYITGGQADAKDASSSDKLNINQYGGAAIVTDYAHVRNCIIRDNSATYGGALALTHGALVSGSLIDQNTATEYGGALYVFEKNKVLSDSTVIASGKGTSLDENMAHVYTSTIVNNEADGQGGGIWFTQEGQDDDDINVRVNSCVIWQNSSPNMANVSGIYNPTMPTGSTYSTLAFYPFSYSGVQNIRVSGTNNISLGNLNKNGVRFAKADDNTDQKTVATEGNASDFSKFSGFSYYGLTNYSVLVRTGMPVSDYSNLVDSIKLSATDFKTLDRLVNTSGQKRTYIEMGARALDKYIANHELMLRLFVAQAGDVNEEACQTMQSIDDQNTASKDELYYCQEGSSFAYPMQNLQDALDYIITKRSLDTNNEMNEAGANNLPFEICVAKGTYYPTKNHAGVYGNSPGNTFAIPEGVSIYGGFNIGKPGKSTSFFGGYNKKVDDTANYSTDLSKNVTHRADTDRASATIKSTYTIEQLPIDSMLPRRPNADNNGNNIIEPWEFKNQTILSGEVVSGATTRGVYHVVSAVADQNVVGMLPKVAVSHKEKNAIYNTLPYEQYEETGSFDYEEGQPITLDGLQITGGRAQDFVEGSTGYTSKYYFYKGGGLLVDGNSYCDDYNKHPGFYDKSNSFSNAETYKKATGETLDNDYDGADEEEEVYNNLGKEKYLHTGVSGAVGFRDIPMNIINCKFTDNEAGYGAAVYSNGGVDIHKSSFEQNEAVAGSCTVKDANDEDYTIEYPGDGGAIFATHQLTLTNTLIANNEATDSEYSGKARRHPSLVLGKTLSTQPIYRGTGGAIYMGPYSYFHIVNCDIVNNQANMYPAVFTMNPNRDLTDGNNGGVGRSSLANFTGDGAEWRPTSVYYNQLINTVIWGNDINETMNKKFADNSLFQYNSRLICNYAPADYYTYSLANFEENSDTENLPASQEALSKNSTEKKPGFGETAWFCAYEENRGIDPLNDADLRSAEYSPLKYARDLIYDDKQTYQNCNILLSSVNDDLEGPNFNSPSTERGVDGFDESADWSPARLCNLTDNGSGKIAQEITLNKKTNKYECKFVNFESIPSRSVMDDGSGYTNETTADYNTDGAYTTTRVLYGYEKYKNTMPVGEMPYMTSVANGQKLWRISYDPNPTHNATYVDIGVYEYPHTQLVYTTEGNEVDILWVSPKEKPENGLPQGSDWSQPTSDLQRAIETLLASRNDHRKEIRLMNGTFAPNYNLKDQDGNNTLSFYINTKDMNASTMMNLKSDGSYDTGKGVKSFTIKGGYSVELNNVYNPQEYPSIFRQQKRSDNQSSRWDHLIYIDDATQRYGYEDYKEYNGEGAWKYDGSSSKYDETVNTIPIEIDGVTLVNNQALPGSNGAAIYYKDRTETTTVTPTAANAAVNKYYTDAELKNESEDNKPTQYYKRVPVYYTDDTYTNTTTTVTQYVKYDCRETSANKLILSKSKVMHSGSYVSGNYTTSAVYIGANGGDALFYNNDLHSNLGNPLVSKVKTTTVNNTYALNYGYLDLGNALEGSSIYNSVFWRNNPKTTEGEYDKQFDLKNYESDATSGSIFDHNAYTGCTMTSQDYSNTGDIQKNNFNVAISAENSNVINGPNFTDPKVNATTDTDIEARDFTLNASLRLLNKGDDNLYNDKVTSDDWNIVDLAWNTTTRTDAAGEKRFVLAIDLGAYEYQNNLNRVIYVNPNNSASGQGNSWESPISYGYLQAAVDLAAVYHVTNPGKEAYVFVKGAGQGNSGLHLGETLVMRNGVSIYGSILPSRTEDCSYTETKDAEGNVTYSYNDADIEAYIKELKAERTAIIGPAAYKTTVSGIKVEKNTSFDKYEATPKDDEQSIVALVDGFDVTATTTDNPTGKVTEPVIDIRPANSDGAVEVSNISVHDNDISEQSATNMAEVNNALIYEALFRDNKVSNSTMRPAYVLNLGSNGYGVNLTVEGKTKGADGTVTYNGSDEGHLYNSIANYSGQSATEYTLSGHNYKVSDKDLNYQLTEKSKHIDECKTDNPIASVANLAHFINYSTDRDLLGNLRLLDGVSDKKMIDRGAFETWRVDNNVVCTSTTSSTDSEGNVTVSKTHFYPHEGSVVYIMEDKNLVMEKYAETTNTETNVTTQTAGTSFQPAYLLLKEGASLYGNGNEVNVAYVGVERLVSHSGTMVSLPYKMVYKGNTVAENGVGTPNYSDNGVLSLNSYSMDAYTYNGAARAAWNSKFYTENSNYWKIQAATDSTLANKGVLVVGQGASSEKETIRRFTAQGSTENMTTYVYQEAVGEISKSVTLEQNDDRTSTNGAADFTEKEDMGWNCIGLPYLVSYYNPGATEELSGNENYYMNIPHTLWLYYDGKTAADGSTTVDGDGGFYSVSSWKTDGSDNDWHLAQDQKPSIWVGEGIFTQTATTGDEEELTFYRPVYSETESTPAKAYNSSSMAETRSTVRYYNGVMESEVKDGNIVIRTRKHKITVSGLEGGESIIVYDTAGRICSMGNASSEEYSTTVSADGVYIVKVNGLTKKMAIHE